jgi:hypothetical protein
LGVGLFLTPKIKEWGERTQRLADLKDVGWAMAKFHEETQRPPENLKELKPYLEKWGRQDSKAIERINKGEIQVVWGALPFKDQDPKSSFVLYTWDNQSAGNGNRLVGFMDSSIREISEDEFARTPKALTVKAAN